MGLGKRDGTNASEPGAAILPVDRRQVLVAATALGAGAASLPLVTAAAPPSKRFTAIRFVVSDPQFPASAQFAATLARDGAERLEIAEGLTALWQQRLVPHWRLPSAPVAGLTTRAVWECLSQQALGQFRRPRLIGVHMFAQTWQVPAHRLDLPDVLPDRIGDIGLAGHDWPVGMAQIAQHCAQTSARKTTACSIGSPMSELDAAAALVSWIIG